MVIETNFRNWKRNYDKKVVRNYKDMKDRYEGSIKGNPLIYCVYIRDFGDFETGLTVIEAGNIDGEYFMTKGHRHKKATKEIYELINGRGRLIIQGKSVRVVEMKKGKVYIIPKKAGHRLVNIGRNKMEVMTIYSKNAGHDYNFKFKKRIKNK